MRNPNFARAQNSGLPLHKILNPPLMRFLVALQASTKNEALYSCSVNNHYDADLVAL